MGGEGWVGGMVRLEGWVDGRSGERVGGEDGSYFVLKKK